MYLIQLLLPLYDNEKRPFTRLDFDSVRKDLTERFGGVTAFLRSPCEGLWKESDDNVSRDDVVMFEVMTDELVESGGQTIESVWKKDFDRKVVG